MNSDFETIVLRAKEDVYTLLQGGNLSRVLGQGYDFSELRTYESSDDIRHISWINSAKLGEPYVKKMHEERELNVVVSMLLNGRTIIGKKQELMVHILALLGYSALYTNNLFQSIFFMGEASQHFEPSKNVEALESVLTHFSTLQPLGKGLNLTRVQSELFKRVEHKSLLFLVGDFLEEIDLSILVQKHEVYVIIVRDKWEESPQVPADAELVNPLTNRAINRTASKKAIAHYVQKLKEHDAKLEAYLHAHQVKFCKVYRSEEVVEKIEGLLHL